MLGFLFRHYDPLVQRFVVYDDGSTDDSLEILRSNPKVEVRPTPPYSDPDSRILSGTSILECCWKESRGVADWVIVVSTSIFIIIETSRAILRRVRSVVSRLSLPSGIKCWRKNFRRRVFGSAEA
jgi:glycosyltransferase involved in cell wall biosynthesis